jgi:predicted chitinase
MRRREFGLDDQRNRFALRRDAVPDQAKANRYAGDAQAIGNLIHAGRNGNGDTATGDGCRGDRHGHRGRAGLSGIRRRCRAFGMLVFWHDRLPAVGRREAFS